MSLLAVRGAETASKLGGYTGTVPISIPAKASPAGLIPQRVMAVEPPQNHDEEGIYVVLADGTVEWIEAQAADRVLKSVGFERDYPTRWSGRVAMFAPALQGRRKSNPVTRYVFFLVV
jgi:hypothetical protein